MKDLPVKIAHKPGTIEKGYQIDSWNRPRQQRIFIESQKEINDILADPAFPNAKIVMCHKSDEVGKLFTIIEFDEPNEGMIEICGQLFSRNLLRSITRLVPCDLAPFKINNAPSYVSLIWLKPNGESILCVNIKETDAGMPYTEIYQKVKDVLESLDVDIETPEKEG